MVCIALSRAAAYALTTGAGCVTARCLSELESEEPKPKATVTSKVFLELEIDGHCAGSVVIGLYGGIAPKTAENFRQLCSGEQGFGYHYVYYLANKPRLLVADYCRVATTRSPALCIECIRSSATFTLQLHCLHLVLPPLGMQFCAVRKYSIRMISH